jgi:hypothetical protein
MARPATSSPIAKVVEALAPADFRNLNEFPGATPHGEGKIPDALVSAVPTATSCRIISRDGVCPAKTMDNR